MVQDDRTKAVHSWVTKFRDRDFGSERVRNASSQLRGWQSIGVDIVAAPPERIVCIHVSSMPKQPALLGFGRRDDHGKENCALTCLSAKVVEATALRCLYRIADEYHCVADTIELDAGLSVIAIRRNLLMARGRVHRASQASNEFWFPTVTPQL